MCKSSRYAKGHCYSFPLMERTAEEAYKNFRKSFGTHTDDVLLTAMTGSGNDDGGDALRVQYHSRGGRDEDNLGNLDKGEVDSFREDLSGEELETVLLNLKSDDDTCIRYIIFTAGRDISGKENRKNLILPSSVIADVTQTELDRDCIWFGRRETGLGDFTFRWKPAIDCFEAYYQQSMHDYAVCLAQNAMIRFDKKQNGMWQRYTQSLW